MIELMKKVAAIKKAFIAGTMTKPQAAAQLSLLMREYGLMDSNMKVEVEEIPEAFWMPCDCLYCRAERGEGPMPLDGVVEVESLRAAYTFGMMSKVEAMMRIQSVFRKHGITERQAVEFWGHKSKAAHGGMPGMPEPKPLTDSEKEFFKDLEEQMKDVPNE